MVGGNRKSANERLRLADWPWPVERRLRRGVRIRAVDCMQGTAAPAWLEAAPAWLEAAPAWLEAKQRLGE